MVDLDHVSIIFGKSTLWHIRLRSGDVLDVYRNPRDLPPDTFCNYKRQDDVLRYAGKSFGKGGEPTPNDVMGLWISNPTVYADTDGITVHKATKYKVTYTLTYTTEVGMVIYNGIKDHVDDLDVPDIEDAEYLDGPTILSVEKVVT